MRYRILSNGQEVNTIEADALFVSAYCQSNGYAYEEAPLPELEPQPAPEPQPTTEERLDTLEAALAQTDETAIELYEAAEEQSQINAAQDEALIEIYEMLEV